ncbi:MAG: hypothetical protein ACPGU5_06475 [Lishizhenia sp.]
MKKLLTLALLAIGFGIFAQDEYEDLLILKADNNWDKLIKVSAGYTEKDKTKNDPLPYYYLAVGLYNISFDADRDMGKYKNAYKDCLSTIGKFIRKDKDGAVFSDKREFFSEVKISLVETIKNDIEAGDYRKAFSWVTKVYKFDRYELGAKYLEGACKYNAGDKSTARYKWKEADEIFETIESINDWKEEDLDLLKLGVMESAKCMVASRQNDKAKEMLDKVAPWFEDDKDFKSKYDEIIN